MNGRNANGELPPSPPEGAHPAIEKKATTKVAIICLLFINSLFLLQWIVP